MPEPEIPAAAVQAGAEALLHQFERLEDDYTLTVDYFIDEAREVLAAALPHVYRDFADLIDRGPAIPLPPSIYSALARERADDLDAEADHG